MRASILHRLLEGLPDGNHIERVSEDHVHTVLAIWMQYDRTPFHLRRLTLLSTHLQNLHAMALPIVHRRQQKRKMVSFRQRMRFGRRETFRRKKDC